MSTLLAAPVVLFISSLASRPSLTTAMQIQGGKATFVLVISTCPGPRVVASAQGKLSEWMREQMKGIQNKARPSTSQPRGELQAVTRWAGSVENTDVVKC